jgi:hypothetical protein
VPKKVKSAKELIEQALEREDSAEVAVDAILEFPFWLYSLSANNSYTRQSDDTDGEECSITVGFSRDGDGWFNVTSRVENGVHTHRFRTGFGGGRSLRVRNALLILARAIDLDNKEKPDLPYKKHDDE